jgi:hypothetical protein
MLSLWSQDCTFEDSGAGLEAKARDENCGLCSLLLEHAHSAHIPPGVRLQISRVGSFMMLGRHRNQPIANLCVLPGEWRLAWRLMNITEKKTLTLVLPDSNSESLPAVFPQLPAALTPIHLRVLKAWLKDCDCHHQHGFFPSTTNFVPTRLIDVGSHGRDIVRLVDTSVDRVMPQRYVALSRCWGSEQGNGQIRTTRDSIKLHRSGLSMKALPNTFLDAVRVVRGLGLQYLWIDSLCIVQGDKDDWDRESKLMERVFGSAYFTLAASCAKDTTDGFLKPRPARKSVMIREPGGDPFYVCEAIDDFQNDVEQSRLNQRGWVLQERALSRRTIFFAERQTYWECGKGVRCETLTKMHKYAIFIPFVALASYFLLQIHSWFADERRPNTKAVQSQSSLSWRLGISTIDR